MVKKIFMGIGIFIVLLVVALVSIPFLFKDKINYRIKEEVNKQVNAKVDYGEFDLSLIHSFPNFSFSLNDLSVVGVDTFKNDTLAYVKNFNFTVDLMSVLKGSNYKLLALNIVEPHINAKINYDGKSNMDIAKSSTDSTNAAADTGTSTPFTLQIKKYSISKGEIIYDDKKGGTYAVIHSLDFEGSGDVTSDLYDFVTKTSIAELTYKSGGVPYLNKARLDAAVSVSVDSKNNKYTFKENSINLNDLGLQFDGSVIMPKTGMNIDLSFKSKKTQFKSILSLIPAVYKKDFDKVSTAGSLSLNGDVKGFYLDSIYPAFDLDLKINDGMFQYPGLPVGVKNITLISRISKPQGFLDKTLVDISKLHLEAGEDPVDAVIHVKTPISNPDVAATFSGRLDLANVPKFYPMQGLETLTGLLNVSLDFKAKKSDIDKKNYAAVQASGSAKIANLVYDSKETPMPVKVPDMQMTFNPRNVTLNNFSAVLGKSDIQAKGTLDNFLDYFFGKGDLIGSLNIQSKVFDANEWLQKDNSAPAAGGGTAATAAKADTGKSQYFKVPAHIDFTASSQFGKIYYNKIVLDNAKGQVVVKDEAINLNNLSANLLGGSAVLNVKYDTRKTDHPNVTFSYDIKNLDIQQTYAALEMAAKMAPVMKYIQGGFSSNLKGTGKLKPDMSVDYNSLNGDGRVTIPSAKIVDLPMLAEVTKVAKIPALQNLEIKNAWTALKFSNGRVNVDPTDLKFGNGYNMHIQGSNGFDQTLDYDMRLDVPSKELGGLTTAAQGFLSQIPGLGSALPQTLGFVFKVTGTASKPVVKLSKMIPGAGGVADPSTSIKDNAKKLADDAAATAKKLADDAAAKAKKEAQDQADKLKKQAEGKGKGMFKIPH